MLPGDIVAYAQGAELLRKIGAGNMPLEYVKSAPYLLSFMDRYELKKKVVKGITGTDLLASSASDTLLLNRRKINNYQPITHTNGKLKYLHDLVFGKRHEKKAHLLLWVPASHPYYKAGGLFESDEARSFSKIILFSSWEMVPRMVSAMMSYYSELYTFGELRRAKPEIKYTTDDRRRYGQTRLKEGNILEYPCKTLAGLYDPEKFFGQRLSDIRRAIRGEIARLLDGLNLPQTRRNNARHLLAIMKMFDNPKYQPDEQIAIPENALDVLTDIAIASPAVCAYRQSGDIEDAIRAAKAIVAIFNKPESAAIIDLIYNKKTYEDYYESVLDYCAIGNLQSVLDEYAHMLGTKAIGADLDEAIIDTSTLRVDTADSIGSDERKLSMRTHFAIPFIDKTVSDKSINRTTNIRKAFNSPFRPFIVSSTSIGQEGLDFHWYSRKIEHWNLPGNPVDLEQREGRINRFKCLAIRRNVSHLYPDIFSWDAMFAAARADLKGADSDMVPFWCLPCGKLTDEQRQGLEKIERIVPLYPLSRDEYRYHHLISVLSLYRMTLGQPRQEELLDILSQLRLTDATADLTLDLCPYNKKIKSSVDE